MFKNLVFTEEVAEYEIEADGDLVLVRRFERIGDPDRAEWTDKFIIDRMRPDSREYGDLYFIQQASDSVGVWVGTVNYWTGEIVVDFEKTANGVGTFSYARTTGYGTLEDVRARFDLATAYVKAVWESKMLTQSLDTKLYLAYPDSGFLREGLNTFVAFADLNKNGVLDPGEPFGMKRNVDVGWSTVKNVEMTLTKESASFARFSGVGGLTIRVVRKGFDGETLPAEAQAVVMTRTGARDWVAEPDFIPQGQYDFDWNYLKTQAGTIGKVDFQTVEYDVELKVGDEWVVIGNYSRHFETRQKPLVVRKSEYDSYRLLTAQPELTWTMDGMTAFRLQIAKDDAFSQVVYDSGARLLPALTPQGYIFRPECYVGEELEDNTQYFWRVIGLNAKYKEVDDSAWSEPAKFLTPVNSLLPDTGYGKIGAEVRYYGPATDPVGSVIVEVYDTADFTGTPVARKHLSGKGTVQDLVNDVTQDFLHVSTNVAFAGIDPGTFYLLAFIDRNGNGKREPYEAWGYANNIGRGMKDMYSPRAVEVDGTKTTAEEQIIFIEDTDVNGDGKPDTLQKITEIVGEGTIGGLDSDKDGIPDWLEEILGTDSLNPDSDMAAPGDVMAYYEYEGALVTLWNGVDDETEVSYLLASDNLPVVGNAASGYAFSTWYRYGNEGPYCIKDEVGAAALKGLKVKSFGTVAVALIHNQVLQAFGFDSKTAVAVPDAVNTKPFTAKDKALVYEYYKQMGLSEEEALKRLPLPNVIDSDYDGIPDGWELYVRSNPRDIADRDEDADKDGLALWQEYDGGLTTDPFAKDTDGDGITDDLAYHYMLKGEQAEQDFDGDGLCNYAEYLISEVFRFAKLDPRNPKTDDACLDYFRKAGELYLGEIFADHDQIDDTWESQNKWYADRYAYDPEKDEDGDGWSNYAEFRAGTDPQRVESLGVDSYTISEYPVPIIKANVSYNGSQVITDPIVFKAWNESNDPELVSAPDAIWTVGTSSSTDNGSAGAQSGATANAFQAHQKYVGMNPKSVKTYNLGPGEIAEGSLKICVKDMNYTVVTVASNGVTRTEVGEPDRAQWYYMTVDRRLPNTNVGEIHTMTGETADSTVLGTVDYTTGDVTIDFSKLTGLVIGKNMRSDSGETNTPDRQQTENATYDTVNLDRAYLLIDWSTMKVGLSAAGTYRLSESDSVKGGKSRGHVREGKTTFMVYVADSNGDYVPGKPFGIVRGVDVGWQGATFDIELTETSAITPRVSVWSGASDRQATIDGLLEKALNDRTLNDEQKEALETRVQTVTADANKDKIRVRVVRYGIDNSFAYRVGLGDNGSQKVLIDRMFDKNGRSFLCESDFLLGGFDIDWGTMDDIVTTDGAPINGVREAGCQVTNLTYLVVIGDGAKDFRDSKDTNTVVNALATVVTRRFETNRSKPFAEDAGIVHAARPTLSWTMKEEEWASAFGSTYTAFKVQIADATGKTVYESDVARLPAAKKQADGSRKYSWQPDAYAGDQTKLGELFKAGGDYTWKVSMYNAKFRSDSWSNAGRFSMAVNLLQEMNDADHSTVKVAVKYAGPRKVIEKVADLKTAKGTVHVQAYATPDFSGEPVAQAVVTDIKSLTDLSKLDANATLVGLPCDGIYYIRAYVDSNGNRVKDAWESWGAYKGSVVLTGMKAPEVGLYIEDADTDGDTIPDAYEYANAGWDGEWEVVQHIVNSSVDAQGRILFANDFTKMTNGVASISTGLPGVSVAALMNPKFAQLLVGGGTGGHMYTADEIREIIAKNLKIKDETLKITAFTLDPAAKKAYLYVDAEVETDTAGQKLAEMYSVQIVGKAKVTVLKRETLAQDAPWVTVATREVEIGAGARCVDVDLKGIDFSSGFFKVEVEQAVK